LGLNLIHILSHHTLNFVIALIVFVTVPAHHHVVGINEVPSFPSIVQPGGVIVNNLDVRIYLAQDTGFILQEGGVKRKWHTFLDKE
jgi:hypothetical protein